MKGRREPRSWSRLDRPLVWALVVFIAICSVASILAGLVLVQFYLMP